jgi:hypothetical protein
VRETYPGPGFVVTLDPSHGRPVTLLARAEIHLLEGPFAGLALRGFSLWRRPSGVLITPPRLSSAQPFLWTSRMAHPGVGDKALRAVFAAILAAHSKAGSRPSEGGR